MRIKVVRTPTQSVIDGIPLDGFRTGSCYEVGTALGALFLAEGWGIPAPEDEPTLPMSVAELESVAEAAAAAFETYPASHARAFSVAADRQRSTPARHPSGRRGPKGSH
jgi:hypothetical protein